MVLINIPVCARAGRSRQPGEHWNTGNRFVINMESTLYTCTSCQGYLVYLKELAKQEGKILEIKMVANKRAKSTGTLKALIK